MHPFLRIAKIVFSAHAEIVPRVTRLTSVVVRILRARGGSSQVVVEQVTEITYSPRTRR